MAQQYLSTVFEGRILDYRAAKQLGDVNPANYPAVSAVTLCPWQFPGLKGDYDLLINSTSFQEMEPHIVQNYAGIAQDIVRKWVYIMAVPEGAGLARRRGERGVLEKVTKDHYLKFFDRFQMIDMSPADFLPRLGKFHDSHWNMLFVRRS